MATKSPEVIPFHNTYDYIVFFVLIKKTIRAEMMHCVRCGCTVTQTNMFDAVSQHEMAIHPEPQE